MWFDGAAGHFGKIEVPEGVAAKCKKAYWRDYPETPPPRSRISAMACTRMTPATA